MSLRLIRILPSALLFLAVCFVGAAVADEAFTLPKDDACYATLEAYKFYIAPLIDDYWQVTEYNKFVEDMERWQQCCPGSENTTAKLRPDKTVPKYLSDIPLPPVFAKNAPCGIIIHEQEYYIPYSSSPRYYTPIGLAWFKDYSSVRDKYWNNQYSGIKDNLYACCVRQFNACLEQASRQHGGPAGGKPASEASTRCFERFSPEYREKLATEQRTKQTEQTERIKEVALGHYNAPDKTVLRSGMEALAAFPFGEVSSALAVLGACALLAGFLLGLPGRTLGRAKLVSGGIGALLALLVFLAGVAFLPDTRLPYLLLALAAAVLVVAFRALIRSLLELRGKDERAPPPP